jgi:DNA-binding beta-propeller fold protein YncE
MNLPPASAFGIESMSGFGQQWASCGDNDNGGNMFMGPTLYSSDEHLLGKQTYEGRGTHLDMLHSTPFCRGIAWGGAKNTFYTFNAYNKSIEYYDFQSNHEPGGDDHSDGIIRRFWTNQVRGVDGLVSHLSYDGETKKLYVADTGNKRILALDPAKGRRIAPMPGANELTVQRDLYEAPVEVVVPPGTLEAPSGIEASGGLAFVTDAATSTIYAFKLSDGSLVRKLATGLPSGSLAGLNFGPEGKIYFVDRRTNRVVRIDPS